MMQNHLKFREVFTLCSLNNWTFWLLLLSPISSTSSPLFPLLCLAEESSAVEETTDSMQELSLGAGSITAAATEDSATATGTSEPAAPAAAASAAGDAAENWDKGERVREETTTTRLTTAREHNAAKAGTPSGSNKAPIFIVRTQLSQQLEGHCYPTRVVTFNSLFSTGNFSCCLKWICVWVWFNVRMEGRYSGETCE